MLSRLERRTLVALVVAGVLVLAGAVWAVVERDRIEVWLTGGEVAAAQRVAMTAELPFGLEDDPTRSACEPWTALRCAWSDEAPMEAALLMAGGLSAAGLDVGDVVCGEQPVVPDTVVVSDAVCVAPVQVALDRMWIVTTDRTPVGHVPLTRTAAWVVWDVATMSAPMVERLARDIPWDEGAALTQLSPAEVGAQLPDRFRALLDGECRTSSSDGCYDWKRELDVADLGDDLVPALVAELVDAGFFVDAADGEVVSTGIRAHRFVDADTRRGLMLTVRLEEDGVVAQVFTV